MTEPSRAVFLSYASQDAEAAHRICDALRAAGIEVWFDQSELRGGDAWDRQIRKQIHDCALFIPIISAHSQARLEGYFRREWKLAADRTHDMSDRVAFLVPVVIDDTREAAADVPDKFKDVQWSRLPSGETPPTFVERVSRLLSPEPAHAPTETAAPHPSSPGQAASRKSRLVPLLIAAVALMAGGYVAFDKFIVSKHVAGPVVPAINPAWPTQSTIPEKSIAVLPFVDMSEKKDQEYFADGLTEELINLLIKIPDLHVPARTSSFYFKGKQTPIAEIAKELNVAYVLEGSVRKSSSRLRITAQLIRADSGVHLWSETYDRDEQDVFKVQDEIAQAVIQSFRVVLTSAPPTRATTKSVDAYRMFLEGRFFSQHSTKADSDRAISAYRAALASDPEYAPAWASLARGLAIQAINWSQDPQKMYAAARDAAQRSIDLDSSAVDGYLAMSAIHLDYDWDWVRAQQVAENAQRMQPDNPWVLSRLADVARTVGRWDDAIAFGRQALARDPLSPGLHDGLGWSLYCSGNLAEAEAEYRRSLQLFPEGGVTQSLLGRTLMQEGRLPEALAITQQDPNEPYRLWILPMIYHAMGRRADSDAAFEKLKRDFLIGNEDSVFQIYAYRGELDNAYAWFDRAYAHRDFGVNTLKCMPEAPAFMRDPRYKSLLRKMNLPE